MNFAFLEKAIQKTQKKEEKKEENNTPKVDAVKFLGQLERKYNFLDNVLAENTEVLEVFDSLLAIEEMTDVNIPTSFEDIEHLI